MNLIFAHELTVFFIALWGFTALMLTGEFSMPILFSCYVLTLGAFIARRHKIYAPVWAWNIIAIVAFSVCGLMAVKTLLDSTVYLFLFLQVVKLFTARTPSEMRWCYVISLFHVIAASVLTTAMSFGLLFLVYVLLVIFSLVLYTLYRESERTELLSYKTRLRQSAQEDKDVSPYIQGRGWAFRTRVPRGLMFASVSLTLFVVFAALCTFSVVPRLQTQNLFQSYGKRPDKPADSAFDESIEFGSFEKINLDHAVALYAQPLNTDRPDHIRLRGAALDSFDGRSWRRTNPPTPTSGRHQFVPFTTRLYKKHYEYRIIQPPGVTNYLFADTFPDLIKLDNDQGFVYDRYSNAAWLLAMQPKEFQYLATSIVEHLEDRRDPAKDKTPDRPPSILEMNRSSDIPGRFDQLARSNSGTTSSTVITTTSENMTTESSVVRRLMEGTGYRGGYNRRWSAQLREMGTRYLELCTTLPASLNTAPIRELARSWAVGGTSPFEKCMSIEKRLRTDFVYSLEPRSRGNFIEDFLLRTREGHCEYFATSMAMLVRSLGIPARVVNGYYSVEWNDIGRNFTVRQRDAHSWVEAWLGDDYGWMTFDPTPPAGVGRPTEENALLLAVSRLTDALRVRWYRYVIDYSFSDQARVMRALLKVREGLVRMFGEFHIPSAGVLFQAPDSLGEASTIITVLVPALLGTVIIWVVIGHLHRRFTARRRFRPAKIMVPYYARLVQLFSKRGKRLVPGQTPREFAEHVATDEKLHAFKKITEWYYGSRFNGMPLDAEQLRAVKQFEEKLRQNK